MPDDAWEVAAGVVRPYLFTQGRTRPTSRMLAVETMLSATKRGAIAAADLPPEQRRIVELCREPLSVAEPLGVIRVLVADLAKDDLLEVMEGNDDGLAADVHLLQRLIARVKAIPA